VNTLVLSGQRAFGYRIATVLGATLGSGSVSHLLSRKGLRSSASRRMASGGSHRVITGDWRKSVQALLSEAGNVVLDTRAPTEYLAEEAAWTQELVHEDRVHYIVSARGQEGIQTVFSGSRALPVIPERRCRTERELYSHFLRGGESLETTPTLTLVRAAESLLAATVDLGVLFDELTEEEQIATRREPSTLEEFEAVFHAVRARPDFSRVVKLHGAEWGLRDWLAPRPEDPAAALRAMMPGRIASMLSDLRKKKRRLLELWAGEWDRRAETGFSDWSKDAHWRVQLRKLSIEQRIGWRDIASNSPLYLLMETLTRAEETASWRSGSS
jgi:hypothetical protein